MRDMTSAPPVSLCTKRNGWRLVLSDIGWRAGLFRHGLGFPHADQTFAAPFSILKFDYLISLHFFLLLQSNPSSQIIILAVKP